jgi:single-stranded DNA-specific DHH superfamily exonuclease
MQNTTQEGGAQAVDQAVGPMKLADVMRKCREEFKKHESRAEELEKRNKKEREKLEALRDEELKLYKATGGWSQIEYEDTVLRWKKEILFLDLELNYHKRRSEFFNRVLELALSSVEHTEHVIRLQGELKGIYKEIESARLICMEANRSGDAKIVDYRKNFRDLVDKRDDMESTVTIHATHSNWFNERAKKLFKEGIAASGY